MLQGKNTGILDIAMMVIMMIGAMTHMAMMAIVGIMTNMDIMTIGAMTNGGIMTIGTMMIGNTLVGPTKKMNITTNGVKTVGRILKVAYPKMAEVTLRGNLEIPILCRAPIIH